MGNSTFLSDEHCDSQLKTFRGCVAALNALVEDQDAELALVPDSLLSNRQFAFGPIVKSFSGLSVVKLKKEAKESKESVFKQFKSLEAKRKVSDAALAALQADSGTIKVSEIFDYVSEVSLKNRDREPYLVGVMLNAFAREAIDPHASFKSTEELQDTSENADEDFVGIGVEIQNLDGKVIVGGVIEGGPSEKVGVRVNDILAEVNGKAIEGMPISEAVTLIRGPVNSVVKVKFLRGEKEIVIDITREKIVMENVRSKILRDMGLPVAYIKMKGFMDVHACTKFKEVIKKMESQGAKAIILDLRNNPGGEINLSVCIAGIFVGKKLIVQTLDLGAKTAEKLVSKEEQVTSLPMVTLINERSASASEIVSGALQDYRRSWILGERSFGKGSVQSGQPIFGGNTYLFQTSARFYQPLGRTNQMAGIIPDLEVPFKPGATEEERFSMREAEIFPDALASLGKPWRQPRPTEVAAISRCLQNSGKAKAKYQSETGEGKSLVDFQLLVAQELFLCEK